MSIRLNRRRSSSLNSNSLLSTSLKRRNSVTSSELEHLHALLQKKKQLRAPFIFLILSGSPVFIFVYQTMLIYNGSIGEALNKELSWTEISAQLSCAFLNPVAWLTVLLLTQFQLLFLWCLPAEVQEVVTSSGSRFNAKHSSFDSYVLICLIYIFGGAVGLYPGDSVYANWLGIMMVLSLFSIGAQAYLFIFHTNDKFMVNGGQSFALEVFFGRHLQPVIFGVDLKMFITNRLMLSLWSLYIISSLFSQKKIFGKLTASLVSCSLLQLVYIARRQWFEYMTRNLDYANDRMGFYRIWGVLVFLPTVYLTPITILAQTKESASFLTCTVICAACFFLQYLNTNIDLQKFQFRAANGQMKIDGKDPYYINAKFRRENGEAAVELLLGSGYWGKARHLNYTTEFLCYFSWSLTAKFISPTAYFPVLFLAALLYGRMQRDEIRCLFKYTQYWLQYISKVPYLIIPGVY